jgi:hypothetical protein
MKENPFQIDMSEDDGILSIVIAGTTYGPHGDAIAQEVTRIEEELKPRLLLIDSRKAVGRADFSTTFEQIKKYHTQYKYSAPKIAVLELEENEGFFSFHETAARNAGLNIRFFTDTEEAFEWLKS